MKNKLLLSLGLISLQGNAGNFHVGLESAGLFQNTGAHYTKESYFPGTSMVETFSEKRYRLEGIGGSLGAFAGFQLPLTETISVGFELKGSIDRAEHKDDFKANETDLYVIPLKTVLSSEIIFIRFQRYYTMGGMVTLNMKLNPSWQGFLKAGPLWVGTRFVMHQIDIGGVVKDDKINKDQTIPGMGIGLGATYNLNTSWSLKMEYQFQCFKQQKLQNSVSDLIDRTTFQNFRPRYHAFILGAQYAL